MRKIYVHLSIGYPTACHDDELEVPDDATEEEINNLVDEWAQNYIEYSWRDEKPKRRR